MVQELAAWRRRIDTYWFWAPARDLEGRQFGSDEAYESLVIADTLSGDELIFHPQRPGELFVLPRNGDGVVPLAGTFTQAIAWMTECGDLGLRTKLRWATPLHGQTARAYRDETADDGDDDSSERFEAVVAALRALDPKALLEEAADEDGGATVLLPRFGAVAFVYSHGDVSLGWGKATAPTLAAEMDRALTSLGLVADPSHDE